MMYVSSTLKEAAPSNFGVMKTGPMDGNGFQPPACLTVTDAECDLVSSTPLNVTFRSVGRVPPIMIMPYASTCR